MPGPRFLLPEDKLPVSCVNKRFIYPTRGAAGAGCLRAGTPTPDRAPQLHPHHPAPRASVPSLNSGRWSLHFVPGFLVAGLAAF